MTTHRVLQLSQRRFTVIAPRFLLGFPFVLCFVALLGCRESEEVVERENADSKPVVLIVSGDLEGRIVPCGCGSETLEHEESTGDEEATEHAPLPTGPGGLPRRASLIEQIREDNETIVVDVGGAPLGSAPYDRLKFEAILQGEKATGLDAHNLGRAELELGAEYLRDSAQRFDIPFISANTCDDEGRPLAPSYLCVKRGRFTLAIIGVVAPAYSASGIRIDDPSRAVLQSIDKIRDDESVSPDAIAVLAYMPGDDLHALSSSMPEIDVIIGGPTGQPLPPTQYSPTWLFSATSLGRFIGCVHFEGNDSTTPIEKIEIHELGAHFEDHPDQLANLAAFRDLLRASDPPAADTHFRPIGTSSLPDDFGTAGTAKCASCHAEEMLDWESSRHSTAWATLEEIDAAVDPDCQRCHTTSYGYPGGFESRGSTPLQVNVGCESCHGPSRAHAEQPTRATFHKGMAMEQCLHCHEPEHSPEYEQDEYWRRIEHGKEDPSGTRDEIVLN